MGMTRLIPEQADYDTELHDILNSETSSQRKLNSKGLIVAGIIGGAAVGLSVLCAPFVWPAFRKICIPYVPATDVQIANVLSLLKGRSGKVVDLGSGDGRIVVEAAKQGFVAHGIELNPWLVLYSKVNAFLLGLQKNATYSKQDLWKADLSKYSNVIVFGVEEMMPKLECKLQRELKVGSCVYACRFPLPTWKPKQSILSGINSVWVYEKS